ncbi:hypothetical protein E2320_015551 [Naja naja]|nr:hypothetical protein E2320_015551 [Naja naja]
MRGSSFVEKSGESAFKGTETEKQKTSSVYLVTGGGGLCDRIATSRMSRNIQTLWPKSTEGYRFRRWLKPSAKEKLFSGPQ